jgi:hypothetical protein
MEVIVIEHKLWYELNERLAYIETMLIDLKDKVNKTPKEQSLEWIPLKKVFEMLGITKQKWHRHYKNLWKTRKHGREVWVYKPDLDKWFITRCIPARA